MDTAIPNNNKVIGMYEAVRKGHMVFGRRRYKVGIHRCSLIVISANFHRSVFLDELIFKHKLQQKRECVGEVEHAS
jgi:hypothetical protein